MAKHFKKERSPFRYLTSALFEPTRRGGYEFPWYVEVCCRAKYDEASTCCSHFVGETWNDQGRELLGLISEIQTDPADEFSNRECCSFAAAKTAFPEVCEGFLNRIDQLNSSPEIGQSVPEDQIRITATDELLEIELFTCFDMEPEDFYLYDHLLEDTYGDLAKKSWEVVPENLIEWEKEPPEGFRAVTYSTGEVVADYERTGLPPAAEKADERVPYLGMGPTAVLYEAGAGNYGVLTGVDALFDDCGNGYIDRQDGFMGSARNVDLAVRRQARRFAWNHPDVTVMVATDESALEHSVSFQVFIPDSLPRERFDQVYKDLDHEFAYGVINEVERLNRRSGWAHEAEENPAVEPTKEKGVAYGSSANEPQVDIGAEKEER